MCLLFVPRFKWNSIMYMPMIFKIAFNSYSITAEIYCKNIKMFNILLRKSYITLLESFVKFYYVDSSFFVFSFVCDYVLPVLTLVHRSLNPTRNIHSQG